MRFRLTSLLCLLIAGIVLFCQPAFAQQTGFSGTITDVQGGAIVGAKVEVKQTGGATFLATTNAQGEYVIPKVTAAEYTLTASASGFATTQKKVLLLVGQLATIDFQLPLASASSTVVVEASNVLAIDTTSSVVSGNVTPSEVQDTPINGRNYNELSALVPGIRANSFVDVPVSGGDAETGKFETTMDGVQVSQSSLGSSFGEPRFSQDAISQFQIITNRFDATAGRSAGIYVNLQSKNGTNQMHGGVFAYFRNSALNAPDPITKVVTPFSDQQFGGTFGGAIRKDKLWYFASFEGERQPNTYSNTPVIGGVAFSHPTLLTDDEYLTRFDYQINDKNHIFVRGDGFNLADAYDGSADPGTASSDSRHTYGYLADWNRNISDRLVNDVRAAFHYFYTNFQPLYSSPVINLTNPTLTVGAPYNRPETFTQPTQQYRDDLFYIRGKHSIKAGGEYLYLLMGGYFPQNLRGAITCAGNGPMTQATYASIFPNGTTSPSTYNYAYLQSYCPTLTYVQGFGSYGLHIPRNIIGIWAQDDWKILPRLTVNLGVRYDNDIGAFLNNLVITNGLQTPNSNPNTNFSPRIGFAYDVFGDGKTSVRGGAGLYYADINGNPTIDDSLFNGQTTVQATIGPVAGSAFPGSLSNPFAGQNPLASPSSYLQTPQFLARGASTPYSLEASFGVARELGWKTTLTADVVHQRVYKDVILLDGNLLQSPTNPYQNLDPGTALTAATYATRVCGNGSIALDTLNTGALSTAAPGGAAAKQVCNQQFSGASTGTGDRQFTYTPGAGEISDGLNVGVKHSTTSGFTGAIAYTWSRTKNSTNGAFSYPNKPFKNGIQQEWANGTDDQRHVITVNGQYKWKYGLMLSSLYHFGSGLAFGSTSGESGLNGYNASTRTFSGGTSGAPTVVTPYAPGTTCPAVTGCVLVYAPMSKVYLDQTYGYYVIQRDAIRGAAYHRVDARLQETVRIHERYSAIMGVEVFNMLNHTNIGTYSGTATSNAASNGYGVRQSTSGVLEYFPRNLQFFGRFSF
jgi:hypothetical protein